MGDVSMQNLADYCSLCGGGYHPNLKISISREPSKVRNGNKEYRWCHIKCKEDHGRIFDENIEY